MRVLRSRWPLLGVIALAMALGWAFARPQEAAAHAILERSLPVQNQQLDAPPQLVETWYSEALERNLTSLEVLDTQGNAVHVGPTRFSDDPTYAAIEMPEDLGPGIYTVTYENVSQVDGHTWSGFFSFVVLEQDGTVPAGEALITCGLAGHVGF
ncbi:MAG: copper resistance protein CopC, partial [Dehalococcoidia bacterium]|nr:copper resistance protein CopC [Dehalococcoidia bacterium]